MSDAVRKKREVVSEPVECGVIMPISSIGECSEAHWVEVLQIITDSVGYRGFSADLVSNTDESTIIHKTIVQNIYNKPIVICDVSEKNANVMFELGLRLAFDKPTIIIKDDRTSYSFDTGAIEHIEYPRDLRFSKIVEFKEKLGSKVKATYEKSLSDENYSTFLSHYGQFTVAQIEKKEVTSEKYIIDQLSQMNNRLDRISLDNRVARRRIEFDNNYRFDNLYDLTTDDLDFCLKDISQNHVDGISKYILDKFNVKSFKITDDAGHPHIIIRAPDLTIEQTLRMRKEIQAVIDAPFHR